MIFINLTCNELKRSIFSIKFLFSWLGIIIVWFLINSQNPFIENVLYSYTLFKAQDMYMVIFLLAAIPACCVYCEDKEHGFYKNIFMRSNLKLYAFSKAIMCIITPIICIVSAVSFGVFLMSFQYPLAIPESQEFISLTTIVTGQSTVLLSGHYFLFFLLDSFKLGLLASMLTMFALLISLFISNRLAVYSVPLFFYYFFLNLSNSVFQLPVQFQINTVFDSIYNIMDNELYSYLYGIAFAAVVNIFCFVGVYFKLRSSIYGKN